MPYLCWSKKQTKVPFLKHVFFFQKAHTRQETPNSVLLFPLIKMGAAKSLYGCLHQNTVPPLLKDVCVRISASEASRHDPKQNMPMFNPVNRHLSGGGRPHGKSYHPYQLFLRTITYCFEAQRREYDLNNKRRQKELATLKASKDPEANLNCLETAKSWTLDYLHEPLFSIRIMPGAQFWQKEENKCKQRNNALGTAKTFLEAKYVELQREHAIVALSRRKENWTRSGPKTANARTSDKVVYSLR